jgi:phosphoribosylformylglycinamidine cyclo-ligase
MGRATYKNAGVDLDVYRDAMTRLPRLMERTFSPRVLKLEGGFAGLFRLDFDNPLFARNYQQPVLVSASDGVGTKLKVARLADRHDTIGIDLVAMCVNDALCCGAEPLFFNDYVAMSQDDPPLLERLVRGVSNGCIEADCALVGGETAIMPDLYAPGDYDLAGFCVGVVEQRQLIDGSAITPGDVVIGIASTGLHSNGFSLVRKIVFQMQGLEVSDDVAALGQTVGDALLTPTRIYVRPVRRILRHDEVGAAVHGIAHITGGGLAEKNIVRLLRPGVRVELRRDAWQVPPVFGWLQKLGDVADEEMARVFNLGIGLALIVDRDHADSIRSLLAEAQLENWSIGRVVEGPGDVVFR